MKNYHQLLKLVPAYSWLFLSFYLIFIISFEFVHHFYPAVDLESVLWWQKRFLFRDGLELPVMVLASFLYLFLAYVIAYLAPGVSFLKRRWVQLVSLLPILVILIRTRSTVFDGFQNLWINLVILIFFLSFLYISYRIYLIRSKLKVIRFLPYLLGALIALTIFWGMDIPSIYDYGYFIGPALKISQGEDFKHFYMQYNLLLTFIFKGMMDLNWQLPQMQIFLALTFILWIFIYYFLASKFIKNKFLLFLFMLALVTLRYFAIDHDPVRIPAVLPARLDLWVPLILILYKFNFLSLMTAISFALVYLLDNTFGFLYQILYLVFLTYFSLKSGQFKRGIVLTLPAVVVGAVQFSLFGSLTSPATKLYQNVQLGFMPISFESFFWLIWAFLPYSVYLLLKEPNQKLKTVFQFLLALIVLQFIYFFGRSHDHNLLNLSGIWLFVLFLTLNELIKQFKLEKLSFVLAMIFLIVFSLTFATHAEKKLSRVIRHISQKKLLDRTNLEVSINQNPDLFSIYQKGQKIFVVSQFDAYINYRYKLAQVGFINPFPINLYVDQTAQKLIDLIEQGYKVVLWETEMIKMIEQLNQSDYLSEKKLMFDLIDQGIFYELNLTEATRSATSNLLELSYFKSGLSFVYPASWTLKEGQDKINLTEPLGRLNIEITIDQKETLETAEGYFDKQKKLPGELLRQGRADIPNIEVAFAKIFEGSDGQKIQFFLFKGDKVVKVLVWPFTSPLMRRFDAIVNTLKID